MKNFTENKNIDPAAFRKRRSIVVYGLCAILIPRAQAYADTPQEREAAGVNKNNRIKIPDENNIYSLDQVELIANVIRATTRVVENVSTLESEGHILGKIEYHYPKAAHQPIRIAYFGLPSISCVGSIRRLDGKSPWYVCELSFETFSCEIENVDEVHGTAEKVWKFGNIGLTRYFFTDELGLVLEKSVQAKAFLDKCDESNIKYNFFHFRSKAGNPNIEYIFEARTEMSSLKDGYPRSFHSVTVQDSTVVKFLKQHPPPPPPA